MAFVGTNMLMNLALIVREVIIKLKEYCRNKKAIAMRLKSEENRKEQLKILREIKKTRKIE